MKSENDTDTKVMDDSEPVKVFRERRRIWPTVGQITSIASIAANLATAAGIFVLIFQLTQTNSIESRRVAIEAIRQTRTPEFLKAFRQAKLAYETGSVDEKDKDALVDSINHVMNVYDDIAIIYASGTADKCLIKGSIYSAAKEWSDISRKVSSYQADDRKHLDSLLLGMDQESCD